MTDIRIYLLQVALVVLSALTVIAFACSVWGFVWLIGSMRG